MIGILLIVVPLCLIVDQILKYFINEGNHTNWGRKNTERKWSDDFQDRLIQEQIQRDQEQMRMDQDRLIQEQIQRDQEQMHRDQDRLFQEQVQRNVEQQNRISDQIFHDQCQAFQNQMFDQMFRDQNQAFQNQMNNFNNPFF